MGVYTGQPARPHQTLSAQSQSCTAMSEDHFDQWEHYNFTQEKAMNCGHSGKQRSKKEASQNTNRHNPGGHERKILTKLKNAERNNLSRPQQRKQKLSN